MADNTLRNKYSIKDLLGTIDSNASGIDQTYVNQAINQIDPSYATKRANLENTLNSTIGDLESSKTGINSTFDNQIENQNLANKNTKNSFSNQVLDRGLGRSTIATSGLANLDVINNKNIANINSNRASTLADLTRKINDARSEYNNSLSALDATSMDSLLSLARELQDRQREYDFKLQQAAEDKRRWDKSFARGGSSGRSSGGSSKSKGLTYDDLLKAKNGSSNQPGALVSAAMIGSRSIAPKPAPAPKKTSWLTRIGNAIKKGITTEYAKWY